MWKCVFLCRIIFHSFNALQWTYTVALTLTTHSIPTLSRALIFSQIYVYSIMILTTYERKYSNITWTQELYKTRRNEANTTLPWPMYKYIHECEQFVLTMAIERKKTHFLSSKWQRYGTMFEWEVLRETVKVNRNSKHSDVDYEAKIKQLMVGREWALEDQILPQGKRNAFIKNKSIRRKEPKNAKRKRN